MIKNNDNKCTEFIKKKWYQWLVEKTILPKKIK